jgi:hypothetical protein
LPEGSKIGRVFIAIGVVGIILRFFIKAGWIKKFDVVDTNSPS